jgi:hypothetical protein
MYLFKIDDEVRLNNRPLGKVPELSDAVLLAKIWKPRERAGEERSTPSMRRPVSVKYVFLSFLSDKDVFVLLFLPVSSCP